MATVRFIPAGAGNGSAASSIACAVSVHPRGCGERIARQRLAGGWSGSSPRVRGTEAPESDDPDAWRFIPAGAGNGATSRRAKRCAPVHPRGCGERQAENLQHLPPRGSSPRVRGTGLSAARRSDVRRFIPAGAGNGRLDRPIPPQRAVHPRGCGERFSCSSVYLPAFGSSPRVRGTGRRVGDQRFDQRFIPAGAGNGSRFPRDAADAPGSSPRVRGTGPHALRWSQSTRFIPAGAGNGPWLRPHRGRFPVHPRGCGERVFGIAPKTIGPGSSPRVRGTVSTAGCWVRRTRFIPAGAGNGLVPVVLFCMAPVHPRGCGERSFQKHRKTQPDSLVNQRTDENICSHRPRRRSSAAIGPGSCGRAASAANLTRRKPSKSVGTLRLAPQVSKWNPGSLGAAHAITALPSSI